jgi:hypothetical protein
MRALVFYLIVLPLICFTQIAAAKTTSASGKEPLSAKANRLLNILKWNDLYDKERKRDIDYILGDFGGEAVKDLSIEQRKQLLKLMQDRVFAQLQEDRKYFRKFLQNQYVKFFTADELNKLIRYFKTDLMQMVLDKKIKGEPLTANEIRIKISKSNDENKTIISMMTNSYLHARYGRFLEKTDPLLAKMIVDRFKEVLDAVFKQLPELILYVKSIEPYEAAAK